MAEDYVNARLVTLTDGVLSIAMTLLVLDVRLPGPAAGLNDAAVWQALLAIKPQLLSYGLSFLVTAELWFSHVQKFRHLSRVTVTLIWLNVAFLLGVGLIPFTTSLLAENDSAAAVQIYAGVMCFSSLMLGLMAQHAGAHQLTAQAVSTAQVKRVTIWEFSTAAVFLISIGVAALSPSWGQYCWLALIPLGLHRRRPAAVAAK